MITIKNIYKKEFSFIESIQPKSSVEYNLILEQSDPKAISYGIECVCSMNETEQKNRIMAVSSSESDTKNILKFLYENAVLPAVALGVVSDILNSYY